MPLISNLGQLTSRIAREIGRQDMDLEIREAIEAAIEEYSDEPLWFLEFVSTGLVTVAGTASYALGVNLIEIDEITITDGDDQYPLDEIAWEQYRWLQTDESEQQGRPCEYAKFDEKIWLYPTPDQAFPYTIYGRERLAALALPSDTNAWITYAWQLLYARVCQQLGEPGRIQLHMINEREALKRLLRKSTARMTSGRIMPRAVA